MKKDARMWGGRFSEGTDELVERVNASITFDQELAFEDLEGSIAHATMLGETGILTADEARTIVAGLQELQQELQRGELEFTVALEDIHMNLEQLLTDKIGPLGGKLHTARSRNDQVATDLRLFVKRRLIELAAQLRELRGVFVELAERHLDVILPGYTHLQVAQPVLLAHHWLAYYEMFTRDESRVQDALTRLDESPLGAGALAGTSFPIDRELTSTLLGFREPARNSLDAVSDRDYVIETNALASIIMMHLSRLSEELIIWSSAEFGFITLPDSHTTGSSIMPQKKNPDVSELVRGKTGRVFGSLLGILTVMKGLPLAYNKDMQEDKEGVFDTLKTVRDSVQLHIDMLPKMRVHTERTRRAAGGGFSNATDLADYLAKKGLPFREAHHVVGQLVTTALNEGVDLQDLPLETFQAADSRIADDIFGVLSTQAVVDARTSYGGTATVRVREQIAAAKQALA